MKNSILNALITGILLFFFIGEAQARRGTPCNTCQTCTDALGLPMSNVYLTDDLVSEGDGPCIVVRGIGATFDGMERELRPLAGKETIGVIVEAPNVLVKNLQIFGADIGIEARGTRFVTLFHLWLDGNKVGAAIENSVGTRITRSVIRGGKIGIDMGSQGDGLCDNEDSKFLRAFAAVISGNHIQNTEVGIVACMGIPVIRDNTIVNNKRGVVLARPQMVTGTEKSEGPYDECACAPTLPGASVSSTLFYSSGCNGCKVHEEWLPALREEGHDILLRISGPGTQEEAKAFDGHMSRCAPQVTDVLGIPGCVPNYTCIATDTTLKVRGEKDTLVYETQISSSAGLAAYATECKTAASERYREEKDCVKYQMMDNLVCGNSTLDIESTKNLHRWAGYENACGTVKDYFDQGKEGCSSGCSDLPNMPAKPSARKASGPILPPPPPLQAQEGAKVPTDVPAMDMASLVKEKPEMAKAEDKKGEDSEDTEKEEDEDGFNFLFWISVAVALGFGAKKVVKS